MAEREVSDRAETVLNCEQVQARWQELSVVIENLTQDQGCGSAGARDSDHCPSFIPYKVDRAGL
ncbi:uncharacterized protein RAG0_14981 [Rhynchosporium agropyri]|uniref:Uncharacterized protein n=1 Tax=Rhynchosporium agropyri TaxID=914238 RepID=A0A1E1LL54_9HELO|nr:uncharacterized protein RAG0_14981 [Rhynchosporium agropyri]